MKKSRWLNPIPALTLLLFLTACGGEEASLSPGPTATPSPTESAAPPPTEAPGAAEFVLPCYAGESFHPITGQNRTNLTLAPLMYEGLYELDGSFTPQPLLCESAAVREDGLTWTFTLRPGVTFSDGSALTASDAAASLRLAMGQGSAYAARFGNVTGVRAADESTLTVTLSAPNGNLPALLDVPVVKETGGAPLGTGPYALTGEGDGLALTAAAGWWQGKALPLESIRLYSVQGADGLIHAFDTGEISLVTADITGANALGYSGSYELWDYPTSVLLYVGYNTAQGPCRDEAVRHALSYGYERTTVAKSLLSQHAQAASLPVSPASPLYDQALADTLAYSPQRMEELLTGGGWERREEGWVRGRETLSLTLLVNTDNSYKTAVADYLASILTREGMAVEVKKLPWEEFTAALGAGEFDLYLGEVKLTADFDLSALLRPDGALNYGAFRDADTDALLSAYLAADDASRPAAAKALYRQIARTAPFTPLCFKNWSVFTHWGKLTGLTPTQQNVFYGLTNWKPGKE